MVVHLLLLKCSIPHLVTLVVGKQLTDWTFKQAQDVLRHDMQKIPTSMIKFPIVMGTNSMDVMLATN